MEIAFISLFVLLFYIRVNLDQKGRKEIKEQVENL